MFSKISRYRKLLDDISTDKYGKKHESRSLRLPPKVSGAFSHIVEEVDRLDHLAYKYYKQPRKWWRICDANPEFMAPEAMLGKDTIKTVYFFPEYIGNGGNPPWHRLIARLSNITGVELAVLETDVNISEDEIAGCTESILYTVNISFNQMNTDLETLSNVVIDEGFIINGSEIKGQIGKSIRIPMNSAE